MHPWFDPVPGKNIADTVGGAKDDICVFDGGFSGSHRLHLDTNSRLHLSTESLPVFPIWAETADRFDITHGGGSHGLGTGLPARPDEGDGFGIRSAARSWLDSVANVRLHGETRQKPTELWQKERPSLSPLPLYPFDIATVSQVRASKQFRITLDTNRYSIPAHYAGRALTLKTYPDRLCLYLDDKLIARHARSYDRFQDFEHPDHPKPLLEQRKKARDQQLFMRFLALSPQAEAYYLKLEERRLNPHHHVRKIVALSDIYSPESVARAMQDAFVYEAFSSEYIANLLEQRARFTPEASALHLTRREDLLELRLEPPDLNIYHTTPHPESTDTEEPESCLTPKTRNRQ